MERCTECHGLGRVESAQKTEAEWQAEINQYGATGTALYNSPLKLVAAGYRNFFGGTLYNAGSDGYCWSSSVVGPNARILIFGSGLAGMGNGNRAHGFSVRCLKD